MITFCIDKEKGKVLSDLLEQISLKLYSNDSVDALFINSYMIHKPAYLEDFDNYSEKDGINILITVVKKENEQIDLSELDILKKKCLDETSINLIFNVSNNGFWKNDDSYIQKHSKADYLLSDSEILFDKTLELTGKKARLFLLQDHFNNSVEFEPPLVLNKRFGK